MDDTFRVRVDRVFGSLSSTSSLSSSQPLTSSLWSLTDEEIEKKSWTRDSLSSSSFDCQGKPNNDDTDDDDDEGPFPTSVDRLLAAMKDKLPPDDDSPNPNPNPSTSTSTSAGDFRKELEDDLEELDDDDAGEGTSDGGGGPTTTSSSGPSREAFDGDEDELEIKNSIGMDCTLDFEEEEDENDKLAVGDENTGDRLYMSGVTDYLPDFNSYNEIPNSFREASRDPRANHLAAKLRLKEDAETARSFNSLHVSEPTEVVSDSQNNASEDGNNPKSILKRKEDQMGSKSEKRVRFESSCKKSDERGSEGDKNASAGAFNGENTLQKETASQNQDSVPDHIRNPSKYTHYTFDSSSDMNEASNRQAYADFLNMIKKSKQSDPDDVPADLSKPVLFNPKRRAGQDLASTTSNEKNQTEDMAVQSSVQRKSLPVSFASEEMQGEETCEMEVEEQATVGMKVNERRPARKYRSKQTLES